ncbi:MAG: UDP-N-acetylmuramate dehydrogenase [Elusimicrobia bacterium]|nr:UDP-N-acetylmuramate dehydrogenase [Elusimicrobiota bacterium]
MTAVADPPWKKDLSCLFPHARWKEPMSEHTTFKLGGPADCFLELESLSHVHYFFSCARAQKIPFFILGWGSNLLVRDGGIRGVVLQFQEEFDQLEALPDLRVAAGAAVRLPRLVTFCADHGLAGSESLVGVPGTVGGALIMNAGTREGEIGDLTESVSVYDVPREKVTEWRKDRLQFQYRHSNLQGQVILGATLCLRKGNKVDIIRKIQELQKKRLQTQPVHTFNVGSVFKNPPGHFVAKIIEEAGLKGAVQGGVRVSPQHANFIENFNRGTSQDVLDLIDKIRKTVLDRFKISLELEVKVVGEDRP